MNGAIEQRIGGAIRAARKSQGLTQDELARRTGVSPGTISNYERGVYVRAHTADLERVVEFLGLDPDDPAGDGDPIRQRMPSDVRTMLDVLGGWLAALPADQRTAEITFLTRHIFPP